MNGFFAGGFAEGAMGAQKMGLAERELEANTGLRSRGLDLQERQLTHNIDQDVTKQIDAQIAQTMQIVSDTIKNATAVGRPPEQIQRAVAPLVESAQRLAARGGRDPAAIAAQVQAQITSPGLVETAGATGRAVGTQRIEQARVEQNQPAGTAVELSPFKEEKDRISAEGSLRDDFTKASKDFLTVRDFYDRMKTASDTGAGDISRVFSFMKMLDPGSTVREGEYATASNAAGVPSAVQAMYNKLIGGGVLSADARKQIVDEGGKIWGTSLNRHSQQVLQYRNIAKRSGLRPENIIIDYTAGSEGPINRSGNINGIRWNWVGE